MSDRWNKQKCYFSCKNIHNFNKLTLNIKLHTHTNIHQKNEDEAQAKEEAFDRESIGELAFLTNFES